MAAGYWDELDRTQLPFNVFYFASRPMDIPRRTDARLPGQSPDLFKRQLDEVGDLLYGHAFGQAFPNEFSALLFPAFFASLVLAFFAALLSPFEEPRLMRFPARPCFPSNHAIETWPESPRG